MHRDPDLHTPHYALRFELTWTLIEAGQPMSVGALADRVTARGWDLGDRPGARVSQTLRGEVRKGRVRRLGRDRYCAGSIPKSTKSRIGSTVRHNRGVLARRARNERPEAGSAAADHG